MNDTLTSGIAIAIALFTGTPGALFAAPATATPPVAGAVHTDIDDFQGGGQPKPKVFIDAVATCDDEPGIIYSITTHHAPDNTTGIEMQWMDEQGATSQSLGEHGTVPSGEGVFDVRALLHTTNTFYASDWQVVVVDCDTDLPDPDLPLSGNPDFTG